MWSLYTDNLGRDSDTHQQLCSLAEPTFSSDEPSMNREYFGEIKKLKRSAKNLQLYFDIREVPLFHFCGSFFMVDASLIA